MEPRADNNNCGNKSQKTMKQTNKQSHHAKNISSPRVRYSKTESFFLLVFAVLLVYYITYVEVKVLNAIMSPKPAETEKQTLDVPKEEIHQNIRRELCGSIMRILPRYCGVESRAYNPRSEYDRISFTFDAMESIKKLEGRPWPWNIDNPPIGLCKHELLDFARLCTTESTAGVVSRTI